MSRFENDLKRLVVQCTTREQLQDLINELSKCTLITLTTLAHMQTDDPAIRHTAFLQLQAEQEVMWATLQNTVRDMPNIGELFR